MIKPMKILQMFLGLALTAGIANAQNVPLCQTANGYSLDQAEQAIMQADNIITQLSNCAQGNLMMCEDAENLYKQAEDHLHQVFFDARGEACTYCDTTRIGSLSRVLSDRETYIRQNLQFPIELAWMWRTYQNWINAPFCPVVGQPPVAPAPLPPAARTCAPVETIQGYYMSTGNSLKLSHVDYNACLNACEGYDWCKSFDINVQASGCDLHAFSRLQVQVESAFNDQIFHIGCQNRY